MCDLSEATGWITMRVGSRVDLNFKERSCVELGKRVPLFPSSETSSKEESHSSIGAWTAREVDRHEKPRLVCRLRSLDNEFQSSIYLQESSDARIDRSDVDFQPSWTSSIRSSFTLRFHFVDKPYNLTLDLICKTSSLKNACADRFFCFQVVI